MASIMGIGLTGLNAAQAALITTSHNIANANVSGYTRQQVIQGTQTPLFSGSGFFGQGTEVDTIKRVYSQFLNNQVAAADTTRAQYDTYSNEISQIDNLLADDNAGLSPVIQEFFNGVQSVAANPSNIPARQTLISDGQSLATRFQQLYARLDEIRSGTETQISDTVTSINSLASQIAQLNTQILTAQAAGPGVPANDLLDKRDELISELNQQVRVTTSTQSDGSVSVFIGSGQPLIIGPNSYGLTATPSYNDPKRLAVGVQLPGGGSAQLPESVLTGGTLGGLLSFRSDALDSAQNALGRIAVGLTASFNAQSKLGQDLNGLLGGNFFNALQPAVQNLPDPATGNPPTATLSATITSVNQLGTNDYVLSYDGTNYSLTSQPDGSVVYSGTNLPGPSAQALGTSTATVTVTAGANATGVADDYMLAYDGTNYSLTNQTTGVVEYSGTNPPTSIQGLNLSVSGASAGDRVLIHPSVEGMSISLASGTINAGDRFLIQPTHYAAQNVSMAMSDPRLVAAAAPFQTAANTTNTGDATISAGSVTDPAGYDTNGDGISDFGPITVTFTAPNTFSVVNTSTGTPITLMPNNTYTPSTDGAGKTFQISVPGQPGLSFSISGTPNSGDVFTLSPNLTPPATAGGAATNIGVSDSRNMVALGALQSKKTLLGGTASYEYAYSQIVSDVGTKAHSAQVGLDAQNSLLQQAQAAQQGLSGVNVDEEAANLIRFQQAYQASARVIDISGKLFDAVLAAMG